MTTANDEAMDEVLHETIEALDCVSGTLHRVVDDHLELVAHEGLPDAVLEDIRTIPLGKGMAGFVAEREEPLRMANLQTDDSGVAEPSALETGMEGSLVAPVIDADGNLKGAIGVAKPDEYEFSEAESAELMAMAEGFADRL